MNKPRLRWRCFDWCKILSSLDFVSFFQLIQNLGFLLDLSNNTGNYYKSLFPLFSLSYVPSISWSIPFAPAPGTQPNLLFQRCQDSPSGADMIPGRPDVFAGEPPNTDFLFAQKRPKLAASQPKVHGFLKESSMPYMPQEYSCLD